MKIVHVITDLAVGGAETSLVRLIRAGRHEGVQHAVISLSSQAPLADVLAQEGIEVRVLGMERDRTRARSILQLVKWLDELQPDVVQTWMYHADLLAGMCVYAAQLLRRVRGSSLPRPVLSWGIHHTDLRLKGSSRSTRWIAKACAFLSSKVPDVIVCCAEAARSSHSEGGYCGSKMIVIPNGIDLAQFRTDEHAASALRRRLGLPESTALVGTVGRYHPVKDYGTFSEALRVLHKTMPECHFIMVGRGLEASNEELVSLLKTSGVLDRCHLLGPQSEPQALLAGLDVFCLSSKSEALPTVIAEAMACQVPCVATNVGDTAYLIGETGRLVPPERPQELGQALAAVLAIPSTERGQLGKAARHRVEQLFSIERSWKSYQQVYRNALKERRRATV
ncbi:glycosyltransferase [Paraburkholderia sp. LEh10]|uniref:glycosyltransferase family 4 protein n=1 Tax=Paraburkholderia sp. LEh10 TaxID=2821353 RepID=UPI001AE87FD8|nr:glycosyltransferase [Paraburkholderia sp. LEh10]MBP0590962.1 glycosyltransferase [Paraburkholderia sp. LEh10]